MPTGPSAGSSQALARPQARSRALPGSGASWSLPGREYERTGSFLGGLWKKAGVIRKACQTPQRRRSRTGQSPVTTASFATCRCRVRSAAAGCCYCCHVRALLASWITLCTKLDGRERTITNWNISEQAAALHRDAILCDMSKSWIIEHPEGDRRSESLEECVANGVDYVALTLAKRLARHGSNHTHDSQGTRIRAGES